MAEPVAPARKCPICGKPTVAAFKPFCSKRCADVDLNRWLTGGYVIPARDDEPMSEDDNSVPGGDEDDQF
ncbi:DNA gyrase inhibitor YacG [Devosia sp. FKR38]|uniref:DNA gyrase inhibitor YacG n=1 Tax=Devosia sp. FKR38 TaxID=2562312 RepID=UPI001485BC0D|nr:DNA gyrase inhibitor YacG [Devosia sp. FKR38]